MPIYEYACTSCEHEFEELSRSFSDSAIIRCPECRSTKVERKLSVFAARQGAPRHADVPAPGPCASCDNPGGACPFSG